MTVDLTGIREAAEAQRGIVNETPLLVDEDLSRRFGAGVYLKAESLQRSGSFKIRGAYNKLRSLSEEERERGVISPSAGNHAQGVALAARLLGARATIVMPGFAPLTKVVATRELGAEVVLEGDTFDDAALKAEELRLEHGYTSVHAFDDERVISGQGTVGLEIAESLPGVSVAVVPIGGGGLISGIATALKALVPGVRVVGVQAEGFSSVGPSLQRGEPVAAAGSQTIADGIAVKRPGGLTLPIIRDLVDEVVEVTDDEIARAIAHCAQRNRLVVEGAGAAGAAALLSGKVAVGASDTVCTVLCGGNIDGDLLSRVIEQVMVRQGRYLLLRLSVLDRSGSLSPLIDSVAEAGANVVDIFHRRAVWLAPLGKVGLELVLEVRDGGHGDDVVEHLQNAGYHVEREEQGVWPE
ncbi:threonine ammonia-lyase [Rubrobacter aplysinae]|uniref:threonine ammonia-lyase n=1 Tax=Rubrobacter aplysinae TaxID=909625 RepID=UPI00064BAEBA|nr:threonine ammonia-lyase [Rubrobacter aplysinae]